jgi:hypothetical protein
MGGDTQSKLCKIIILFLVCINFIKGWSFSGVKVTKVKTGKEVSLESELKSRSTLTVLGTYAADFNAIEYLQRLKFYMPVLSRECGVDNFNVILNSSPESAKRLAELVDLPASVNIYTDKNGYAGKAFGVSRGWLADVNVNPYLKLFGMFWGFGGKMTLPSVIGGYIGNPSREAKQGWIEESLRQGTLAGRFPGTALELDDRGTVIQNKFDGLPIVSNWGQRPLELATLRLQNMIGISLDNWEDLKPENECLDVLTQLGGVLCMAKDGSIRYEYRDDGICHVADFPTMITTLKENNQKTKTKSRTSNFKSK